VFLVDTDLVNLNLIFKALIVITAAQMTVMFMFMMFVNGLNFSVMLMSVGNKFNFSSMMMRHCVGTHMT
jgi:hypothetical protein